MLTLNLGVPVHACRNCSSSKGALFQCCNKRCERDVHMTCALSLCSQNKAKLSAQERKISRTPATDVFLQIASCSINCFVQFAKSEDTETVEVPDTQDMLLDLDNPFDPRAAIFKYRCGTSDESTDDEKQYVIPVPVDDAPSAPKPALLEAPSTHMKRKEAPAVTPETSTKRHKSKERDDDNNDEDMKLLAESPAAAEPLVLHSAAWFGLEELNLRWQEVESHVLMCATVDKEAEESILLIRMKRDVFEKQT
jgi:hypothetical protein